MSGSNGGLFVKRGWERNEKHPGAGLMACFGVLGEWMGELSGPNMTRMDNAGDRSGFCDGRSRMARRRSPAEASDPLEGVRHSAARP